MTQAVDRSEGLRAWLDGAAQTLGAALGDSGGAPGVRSVAASDLDDVAVREALPELCSAFVTSLSRGDVDGPLILLLPPAAARRCAWAGADDAAARCGSDDALTEEERAALQARAEAVGATLKAALGDALDGAAASETTVAHLADSKWSTDDPLVQGTWVSIELEITLDGVDAAPGRLLVATRVVEEVLPALLDADADAPPASAPAPTASPGGGPAGFLAFTTNADTGARVTGALAAVEECAGLAALVAAWSRDDVAGAVVEVPEGEEYMLATLRGLKEFPGCEKRPIVVLLAEPTMWNVIRCGRLGLFDVLPADCEAADLVNRVSRA